ncbi:MAG TPA: tellurium resistance protein TerA [Chromatiaceae bacterium]|jgi:tellurite resistance protein TerA|nr:MAG: hypothetical protein N838_10870 [Thiohalocapsa sp. PB-PSB1]QQO52937.1 MAG: tellurium resistance protein TerA [Thiohalocapsa sp. PB-PSB1]HBG95271.1 tellurium resistance protein TerA [Chromatiaceae bacterium]HCS91731.1 tellurium resistance protein TerA [Chromatiaceae bacterium]
MDMQSGQNAPVSAAVLSLNITAQPAAKATSLDLSFFILDTAGRVIGDQGFVFYGNENAPGGAIRLRALEHSAQCELGRLGEQAQRVVIALSIDTDIAGVQTFAEYSQIGLQVVGDDTHLRFPIQTSGMSERALILGEFYLRNGIWKLRALGQGFAGGLEPLARNYGVDVSDAPPTPTQPRPAPVAAPPKPPSTPARINLEKRKPISLEKPTEGFGEISVNLNWHSGPAKQGFFGIKKAGIDLDLGCMLELVNGDKGVIQALGGNFGTLDRPPFVKLLGDDRTGAVAAGETLLINGKHWSQIRRVLIFAFIYEGVANWAQADAVVTLKTPGQPELVVALDEHSSSKPMCAIAMLDNDGGRIQVTKHVEYFPSHKEVDSAFGFGFKWVAGRK